MWAAMRENGQTACFCHGDSVGLWNPDCLNIIGPRAYPHVTLTSKSLWSMKGLVTTTNRPTRWSIHFVFTLGSRPVCKLGLGGSCTVRHKPQE